MKVGDGYTNKQAARQLEKDSTGIGELNAQIYTEKDGE